MRCLKWRTIVAGANQKPIYHTRSAIEHFVIGGIYQNSFHLIEVQHRWESIDPELIQVY